jgi:glycosyltransferase involved in cell wall biosynthesis
MAAKKPIVSSDTICLKEILDDSNAYLFEASSVTGLQEAIIKAIENPVKSEELVGQAYRDVQGLTWQKRASRIIEFIKKTGN